MAKGFREVDAAREIRAMNVARVAYHASGPEAQRWVEERGTGGDEEAVRQGMRNSWRASLEELGFRVEE